LDSFDGKLAVVTGGGSGMGRALVVQLASDGCSVATCDVNEAALADTAERARANAPGSTRITVHTCDVSDEIQVTRFRDEVVDQHRCDHVDLVFNNAGIGGGSSFVSGDREEWDRTFGVCWFGVYYCARAFVPLLVASDDAYLVNTSSVNGFWASLGAGIPHTAYSTAKFAVKGFSEALIEDLAVNAPHVKVAVVMPGHIGTDIVFNSQRFLGGRDEVDPVTQMIGTAFRDAAPLTAAGAASVILDGVRSGSWRILVGDDAVRIDEAVRSDPEHAYGPDGITLQFLRGA
jgi:NAD(P)-dependent dehydrogenase (short-subunit alcohol dehydrogenase family)